MTSGINGEPGPMGRVAARERVALLAVLLAGTALRGFHLGAGSLWYDETVSTYLAGSPVGELLRHTAGDIHPPGYYLLLRGWLVLSGYPTGRADPHGNGLEFASGFFSLFFGVLLIALVYALARRLGGRTVALVAALLVALSPFNVWYSQEVRMYTLGAALGLVVLWALLAAVDATTNRPYVVYALAAALGTYVLYYFAFLLAALNLWALVVLLRRKRSVWPLVLANLAAAVLYAPWIGTAFRQATQPPVPPWRAVPQLPAALLESWQALSFGPAAPVWIWPALLLTLALYALGLRFFARRKGVAAAVALAVATLGPLFLILVISFATPLYHVRYLFTYSPAFYIVLAGGLVWLGRRSRGAAGVAGLVLLLGAALSLREFWFNPAFAADDHRAAVRELQARWRPGDVVLVNAGWAYTALATYWDGDIAGRYRLTGALPEARSDDALVMVTTGHTDGDAGLGWGDSRSDFFAMPSQVAKEKVADLLDRFGRVWHYRIYDTVNDPDGLIRALLSRHGQELDERTYPGEAYLRVEGYTSRDGAAWEAGAPGAIFGDLALRIVPPPESARPGATLFSSAFWLPTTPLTITLGTSLRLADAGGDVWAASDEQPLGPLFTSENWPANVVQRQPLALTVPQGTVPGDYDLVLVPYDAGTGRPLSGTPVNGAVPADPGLVLGRVTVQRAEGTSALPALAQFGPLALIEAGTPVAAVGAGGVVPVDLLWQALEAPGEPLVVVIQALDEQGAVAANLEEQPLGGRYPTTNWQPGELVRDRHTLSLPADLAPGRYRLIVGAYQAADGKRLTTRTGLLTESQSWIIKEFEVR